MDIEIFVYLSTQNFPWVIGKLAIRSILPDFFF